MLDILRYIAEGLMSYLLVSSLALACVGSTYAVTQFIKLIKEGKNEEL